LLQLVHSEDTLVTRKITGFIWN